MATASITRSSILDNLTKLGNSNKFCSLDSLSNEASVETFFIIRLLDDLGYKDNNIKTKESLQSRMIAKGTKKVNYKPDYIIVNNSNNLLVVDAKSPDETLEDHIHQLLSYCIYLNMSKFTIHFCLISNGKRTLVLNTNNYVVEIEMDFMDFLDGNERYEKLRSLLSLPNLESPVESAPIDRNITMKKILKEEAQKIFLSCHKYIWNTEKKGPLASFTEFVKLIFIKLWVDKQLNDKGHKDSYGNLRIKESSNTFSVKWIESRENEIQNPVNDILYKQLLDRIQDDIDRNSKKTIFDKGDRINLKPMTIKGVVKKLEKLNLFGIDEDLNGRLFETFLSATMRGQALGQYFTPRSIVVLAAKLANLQANRDHVDVILDASCGTGGFLIEALSILRNKIRSNTSYSSSEKDTLLDWISRSCIYGIDAASDPLLSRIARINMYLHGDGGSHIYYGDGLKKCIEVDKNDPHLVQLETQDMQQQIVNEKFDVVLTNPPFSMWYSSSDEAQNEVLKEYELIRVPGTSRLKKRLRGSEMFLERYLGLLKPGGRLLTIIDDTVLSSKDYSNLRSFLRRNYIVRAIISLHGDAFQMSNARAKTSLLYLEKKISESDSTNSVFMYPSIYLGVDDMPLTTRPEIVKEARRNAENEIEHIVSEFSAYSNGTSTERSIPMSRLLDRMDYKSCVPDFGRFVNRWKQKGYSVMTIEELFDVIEHPINTSTLTPDVEYEILTIQYNGMCEISDRMKGKYIKTSKVTFVKTGYVVFSRYNAYNGAIGFITQEFDNSLASSSYIVTKCKNPEIALYLWSIMRSTEIRADILSSAKGMGRQTVEWNTLKKVSLPLLDDAKMKSISNEILSSWEKMKQIQKYITDIFSHLNEEFNVESTDSLLRFEANKPPK